MLPAGPAAPLPSASISVIVWCIHHHGDRLIDSHKMNPTSLRGSEDGGALITNPAPLSRRGSEDGGARSSDGHEAVVVDYPHRIPQISTSVK